MKLVITLAAVAATSLLVACGSKEGAPAGDIATTNTGNVVLNDAQADYAFRGDNEQLGNTASNYSLDAAQAGNQAPRQ